MSRQGKREVSFLELREEGRAERSSSPSNSLTALTLFLSVAMTFSSTVPPPPSFRSGDESSSVWETRSTRTEGGKPGIRESLRARRSVDLPEPFLQDHDTGIKAYQQVLSSFEETPFAD